MQHIDSFRELGNVEDTPFSQHVYPNFSNATPYLFHGLPVRGIQTTLYESQFEPSRTPSFSRKLFQVFEARADELQAFHARII
jgi:hypothetical protein